MKLLILSVVLVSFAVAVPIKHDVAISKETSGKGIDCVHGTSNRNCNEDSNDGRAGSYVEEHRQDKEFVHVMNENDQIHKYLALDNNGSLFVFETTRPLNNSGPASSIIPIN